MSTVLELPGCPMSGQEEHPSGTVRVAGDVLFWLQSICLYERGPGGRKLRASDIVDALLREPVRKRYEALKGRLDRDEKRKH